MIIDDRLLVEELLVGLPRRRRRRRNLYTTAYWYYRACRAAVAGAGGRLSGPFEQVPEQEQQRAVLSLLELPDGIGLPEPRATVPVMADAARRYPRLNLLNLEALGAARVLDATIWLSARAAKGVLPSVLDQERVTWRQIELR